MHFPNGAALPQLGGAALRALEQELGLEQALTFSDLEWRSYRLLCDPGKAEWIRYKLDQKIDHLLIDEFQDTSPTQWRLLRPFLEEMAAGLGQALPDWRPRLEAVLGAEETFYARFLTAVEAALPASRTHGAIPLA